MTPRTKTSTPRLSKIASRLNIPAGIVSTGWGAVSRQLGKLGVSMDPWQNQLGQLILAKRADGKYAAGEGSAVISIPRQAGKTHLVGWTVYALCILFPGLTVLWTAHRTRTANETFTAMRGMSMKPTVAPFVQAVRAANGEQAVLFRNGSRILFGARESGFGRGFAGVDVLVFDEAQILSENAMSDMVPAMNASANGLVLMTGTPPRPKDPSEVFMNSRMDALGGNPDILYVEFSADDDVNPGGWKPKHVDWKQVAKANPSYPHRTGKQSIQRMRNLLSADDFRREALGVWDRVMKGTPAIPWDVWAACQSPGMPAGPTRSFAVKFTADGSLVALAAASKLDKETVLVDSVRLCSAAEGLEWLVEFLTDEERLSATQQIVIEGKAGAGYLVDRLRAAGVRERVVWTPSTDQAITAHSMFLEAVRATRVVHRGDDELNREVENATIRKIGKTGGFGWQAPEGDTVAMLDAVTFAFWAARTSRRRPRGMVETVKVVEGGEPVTVKRRKRKVVVL